MDFPELKKQIRAVDLSLRAARKRQSPRTGFVHFFHSDETASDTIPLFENFCFALALFRQKTAEAVLEGKELIERLLAFQAPNGNFPVYLHDYPRTWDPWMPLKVAPALLQILRHFGSVLSGDVKQKIELALSKALSSIQEQKLAPLWRHRYFCLTNQPSSFIPTTAEEWFETLISDQLSSSEPLKKEPPFHPLLQAFIGPHEAQDKEEPSPLPIEWLCSEDLGYHPRLLNDHPRQIYTALVFPFEISPIETTEALPFVFTPQKKGVRVLWKGTKLHSLVVPMGELVEQSGMSAKIAIDLKDLSEPSREDLFEALLFCNLSSETQIFIEKQKGLVFRLQEKVEIQTPLLTIEALFTLLEGQGDFCGQISRANRPSQTACQKALLYEVFDWKIGLRTLRREAACKLQIELQFFPQRL